jgi:thioredoxin reductase (NADPH)
LGFSKSKVTDVIVIGAGPSGLSASLYAGRAKLSTIVIEKGVPGGLAATTHWIENYPGFPEGISGSDLMQKMVEQVERFGSEFVYSSVNSVSTDNKSYFSVASDSGVFTSKAVIISTGTNPLNLDVPGEDRLRGLGVSYCATCDGPFFRGKDLLVIGGGDSAIAEALFLTRFASKVTVVHRRDQLRAAKSIQDHAFNNPKIEFRWDSVVNEILGEAKVEGAVLKDVRTGRVESIKTDGIFVAIGSRPDTGFIKVKVDKDERGYILTDERMRTPTLGLFAAGDVRAKSLRQVVTAVSDGAIAAVEAEQYLAAGK